MEEVANNFIYYSVGRLADRLLSTRTKTRASPAKGVRTHSRVLKCIIDRYTNDETKWMELGQRQSKPPLGTTMVNGRYVQLEPFRGKFVGSMPGCIVGDLPMCFIIKNDARGVAGGRPVGNQDSRRDSKAKKPFLPTDMAHVSIRKSVDS